MTIRRLPEHLINRIAAGEVVERPASALKELVENAIDAGARAIHVSLAGGGTGRIEIADDGCGMTAAEMRLAVERHATRSEEHTSELQSLMRISYAVLCLKKKRVTYKHTSTRTKTLKLYTTSMTCSS